MPVRWDESSLHCENLTSDDWLKIKKWYTFSEDRSIYKWFIQKDKVDPTPIDHLVIFETFLSITAHTEDTIKNDSVFFFTKG